MKYDIIVIGAGHAGVEASYAASHAGKKTALITINIKNIADMPCNPSIGGTAKGIVVREIDALGGIMGKACDKTFLQMKMLNSGKGPAVRCLRAQGDKITYPKVIKEILDKEKNLTIIETTADEILTENNKVIGIKCENVSYFCDALILTTGTYLKSMILRGSDKKSEGPHGEKPALYLSDSLLKLGFKLLRLKTGTPPRIKKTSIDFSKVKVEPGDNKEYFFSHDNNISYNPKKQIDCHLTYTNETTHKIITDNLEKSSMYGGYASGTGARYCPSIEDKVVRFSDKDRHQLFLEPESRYYDDIYVQGLSTSFPKDIQELIVHSIKGLEHAEILKYAYAIEYDAIDPLQVMPSLESKLVTNLFTAGQINGTSGYEEAAGQGLIAGINAVNKLNNKKPLILKRSEAYIGVLIDDLVTKGTIEPYRLLTSRAEFRLILRHDNADLRLREYGYKQGLISDDLYQTLLNKIEDIKHLIDFIKNNRTNEKLFMKEVDIIKGTLLDAILKRSEFNIYDLVNNNLLDKEYLKEVLEQVEIEIKYEGYIKKELDEVNKLLAMESKIIPEDINYDNIKNLASEARQKLKKVRPKTFAQAARISGVNPADMSVLAIYLKKEYANE